MTEDETKRKRERRIEREKKRYYRRRIRTGGGGMRPDSISDKLSQSRNEPPEVFVVCIRVE